MTQTNPLQLGLMGYGAIGQDIVKAAREGVLAGIELPAVLVRTPRDPQPSDTPPLLADPEAFFAHRFDVVCEVAGHSSIQAHAVRVLEGGADLMMTSVGAFADQALFERVMDAARSNGQRVILPSAGVGGLDMLAGAAQGGLDEVIMTVRKEAEAWKGTVAEEAHDLDAITEPVLLYDGTARGGAASYPQNVNIAAAVSLAGMGLDDTTLRIWAMPGSPLHIIEVEARGTFGRLYFRDESIPTKDNPKTGLIVGMAVIKTLRQLTSTLVVGH